MADGNGGREMEGEMGGNQNADVEDDELDLFMGMGNYDSGEREHAGAPQASTPVKQLASLDSLCVSPTVKSFSSPVSVPSSDKKMRFSFVKTGLFLLVLVWRCYSTTTTVNDRSTGVVLGNSLLSQGTAAAAAMGVALRC